MARPDGRVERGQKINKAFSAKAWNRAQAAADLVLDGRNGGSADETLYGSSPYTAVVALNNTGADVARWGIMEITGVQITPTSTAGGATAEFERMPVLTGGTPSATTTAWCVAVEPIKSGRIGRVAVAGVVQVKLEVIAAGDKTAFCKASTQELKTGADGTATILWKDSGTGSGKWALVRFGTATSGVRLGHVSATWSKGSTATVTHENGDGSNKSPTVTFTATNYFATVTVTAGTKRVACAKVDDTWVLIAAEC